MTRRLICVVSVAALLIPLAAPPAFAVAQDDPADSGLKIDIARIAFREDPENVGRLTIRAHSRWRCRHLRPAAKTQLKWLFDGSGNREFDLVGNFECRDGKLLFKLRSTDGSNNYEPIVATRPNRRSVRVSMPLDLIELNSDHLDLVAKSKDASGETCIENCVDRAPDQGRMRAY